MPILPLLGDSGADQILGDGVEVVEALLPVLAKHRLVPFGAIFAAAADVGEDIGIALLGPEHAERAGAVGLAGQVAGRLGGAEAAIGVDQGRHRPVDAFPADEEIGDSGAVLRGREALLDGPRARRRTWPAGAGPAPAGRRGRTA